KAATVLALVVHGGGQRFIAKSPEKTAEIRTFIQSLKFPDPDATIPVKVYAPVINKLNEKNRFGQPWTYFVDLPPNATLLREYLLWQKVFAVHATLSFSVYPILQEQQPWTIMVLSGPPDAVEDTKEARRAVLAQIKQTMWADKYFCYFVARLAAKNWGIAGSMAELVKATTDTLEATVVMAEDPANGRAMAPAFLITGRPPSDDKDAYARWVSYYTAPGVYWVDRIYQLKVNKLVVECKLCKDTTHCARECPLVMVPGWQG
ncbi:hypothetical protein BC628DRAFT_1304943, partial [Trametes gibbosa]